MQSKEELIEWLSSLKPGTQIGLEGDAITADTSGECFGLDPYDPKTSVLVGLTIQLKGPRGELNHSRLKNQIARCLVGKRFEFEGFDGPNLSYEIEEVDVGKVIIGD